MPSRISRALLFAVAVLGLLNASTSFAQSLHKTNAVENTLYDPDPTHIANRVYKAVFTWKSDEDAPPNHWPKQKVTLDTANLKSVLDELLQADIGKEFPDPLKRIFLQRDLWLAFDWIAQQPAAIGAENPVIQRKLTRCIQHLALPQSQLRQVPDNYDEELISDAYPIEFDSANPNAPFLPGGLWMRNGSWILIGDRDTRSILASQHLDFFRGHNAYMVFVRLPGGSRSDNQIFKPNYNRYNGSRQTAPTSRRHANGPRQPGYGHR